MGNQLQLSPVMEKFILHWGEMGSRWGINRSVAQVHALLYLSPRPLHAEEISGTLSIARSTVSTNLRELQSWGIVRVVHVLGDRRDHYESVHDVWQLFRLILEERKGREVDPTIALLRECVADLEGQNEETDYTREQLAEMLEFFEMVTSFYEQIKHLPTPALKRLARLGGEVSRLTGSGGKR